MDNQSFARASAALTSRLAAELERCFQDALREAIVAGLGAMTSLARPARTRATPPSTRKAASTPRRMTDSPAEAPAASAPADSSEPKAPEPATNAPTNAAFARAPLVIPVRVRTRRRAPKRTADEIALVESRIVAHVEKAPGAVAAAIAAAIGVPKGTVSWPLTKLVDGGKLVATTDASGQKTYALAPPPEPTKTRIIRRRAADAARVATLPTSG